MMPRWLLALVAAVTVIASLAAQAPPSAAPPPLSPSEKGATISGVVVDAVSRKPIGAVVVTLFTVPSDSIRIPLNNDGPVVVSALGATIGSVMTGADGRFKFERVPRGAFDLSAERDGWIDEPWESSDSAVKGAWIAVSSATREVAVTIPLRPSPVIAGRVVDERGDPAVGVSVWALGAKAPAGHRSWSLSGGGRRTDDRGAFRFSVDPGDFLVAAIPALPKSGEDSLRTRVANGRLFVYGNVFYPAAISISNAEVFHLEPGDERVDLEVRMAPMPVFRVTGRIEGYVNPREHRVSLTPVEDGSLAPELSQRTAILDAQGRFAFDPVRPGRYLLRSFEPPPMPYMTHGVAALKALPAESTLSGEIDLDVRDHDLDVVLPVRSGVRIRGRVEFDGDATDAVLAGLKNIPVLIERADGESTDLRGIYLDSKTFETIQVPPGRYLMDTRAPQGWVLRSIVHEGRPIADEPFDVGAAPLLDVVITFTNRPSAVTGSIAGISGLRRRPSVVAFPTDRRLWTDYGRTPRRIAVALVGTSGHYELELPPGGYHVLATDDLPELLTPSTLDALVRSSTQVWIAEGERRVQALTVVPARTRRR